MTTTQAVALPPLLAARPELRSLLARLRRLNLDIPAVILCLADGSLDVADQLAFADRMATLAEDIRANVDDAPGLVVDSAAAIEPEAAR